jgi:hypothetical protein
MRALRRTRVTRLSRTSTPCSAHRRSSTSRHRCPLTCTRDTRPTSAQRGERENGVSRCSTRPHPPSSGRILPREAASSLIVAIGYEPALLLCDKLGSRLLHRPVELWVIEEKVLRKDASRTSYFATSCGEQLGPVCFNQSKQRAAGN